MKFTPTQARAMASPFPRTATVARAQALPRRPKWWRNVEVIFIVIIGLFGLLVLSIFMLFK